MFHTEYLATKMDVSSAEVEPILVGAPYLKGNGDFSGLGKGYSSKY